ncbi:MAG: hypothetical protein GY855_05825 [candidate division Zixibacteria bacterium]|nr:hypothetical protein [candidate division Zixibacteria bacterium]
MTNRRRKNKRKNLFFRLDGLTDKLKLYKFRKFFFLIFSLFIIMLFAGGDYGLIRMWQVNNNLSQMQKRVDLLRIKNIDLHAEKQLLLSDVSYRKLIAAEKYGMVSDKTLLCRLVK